MKQRSLSDNDVMSGGGWYPESWDFVPCPRCGHDIDSTGKSKYKCPECSTVFKLKKGIKRYIKAEIV